MIDLIVSPTSPNSLPVSALPAASTHFGKYTCASSANGSRMLELQNSMIAGLPVESPYVRHRLCQGARMGFFGKRPQARRPAVPGSVIASLAAFGEAVMAAKRAASPVTDPRFGWEYMEPVMMAMTGAQRDQVIQELYDAALQARDREMAMVGAYKLLCEFDGNLADERFQALRDFYLDLMQRMGFPSAYLTGYEMQRRAERGQ